VFTKRNGREKANAPTTITIENEMISDDADFNKKVIDYIFSEEKNKKIDMLRFRA